MTGSNRFSVGSQLPADPLRLRLATASEGTWFVVERVRLLAKLASGETYCVAEWKPESGLATRELPGEVSLTLSWCAPREIVVPTARFACKDAETGGDWKGELGAVAAWIPLVTGEETQNGYRLRITDGKPYTWADAVADKRVPQSSASPKSGNRRSTCWFDKNEVSLSVTPPDGKGYRLTVYLLDYDRHGRAMDVKLSGDMGTLDAQQVSAQESQRGVYLAWSVAGPVTVAIRKLAGYNAVISGVFVDPP